VQTVVVRQAGDAAADEDDEQKKDWKFGRNEGGMSWGWKLCAAILYMLPWVDVTEKTVYFIERFPVFAWTEYFTGGWELRTVHTGACVLHTCIRGCRSGQKLASYVLT
jgi:hypothetical protein